MAFCTKSMFNSVVTSSIPKRLVTEFKHWLGIMSDEEYAKWLNEPEQNKLWRNVVGPYYNNAIGPSIPNKEPKSEAVPLMYNPAIAELPADMMFMHEAVFDENEKVSDIELGFKECKDNWWDEVEGDENIRRRGKDKVQDYLDNSEKIECLY